MTKRRAPRQKQVWRVKVRGEIRPDIDIDLLTQAVIALGHQFADEEKFFQTLQQHDERIGTATLLPLRMSVCVLDGQVFALFDGGHLVCWLPEDEVAMLSRKAWFRQWEVPGTDIVAPSYIRLPSEIDPAERIRYGLAALAHAQARVDSQLADQDGS